MNELIKEIQKVLDEYWDSERDREIADYSLHAIQDLLTNFEKENN